MKILNFGSCNIDFVYSLDHIVNIGETETTHSLDTFPGGKGLNQSIALARAGASVYHAGCVGEDGSMLTDVLKESGVDVSYMKKVPAKNGHAIIQVSARGENSIFLYPGSNEMISEEYIDEVLNDFSKGDIILLQNEINNISYIIDIAYERGMQIVLNPSPFNEKVINIDLNKISYLILNEIEAKNYCGYEDPERIILYFTENYPKLNVMLTLGTNGCVFANSEIKVFHPIFEVNAVDTTAAGDTFTGYFIEGVSRGDCYEDILKIASAASAISVSRNGAAPSIPLRSETIELMRSMTVKNKDNREELIKRINTYLRNNLCNLSLRGLAEELKYSSVYTGKLIKQLTGMCYSDYVHNLRCQVAAELLRNTGMSVNEVIASIGYENGSFFRKKFKEKYGKNPHDYRKNYV